jgi:adenylate cyclase
MVQADTRRLAAIMFTDIVGFSRQMGADEARMLGVLAVHNQLIQQAIAEHHGHVIKTLGDAFLVDFPSVVNAVQCAQRIQDQLRIYNSEKDKAEQIHIRIGIHLGDIIQQNGDVLGDGVNIASRLQTLAEPDTICISDVVYRDVAKKVSLGTVVSLGRPKLKNIAQRFQVYALLPEKPKGFHQNLRVLRLKTRRVGTAHRAVVVAVLLTLVSAGTLVIKNWYFPPPSGLPLPDKPSIVVLPFVNMSEDPKQEYFSDGITEDLTSDLSKISGLFVIARNSAFTYKGKAVKVEDIGRELGVRYVLEGSMRRADDQVRITAQLIDATTGYHLWSERYDRPLKDIFALQDEIVQKIVTTLKLQLTLMEQGILVRKTTDNLEAYDYYLRGLEYFFRLTKEANTQAQAYASLSIVYWIRRWYQWSPDPQNLERAFELARKAVELDDAQPTAHWTLGYVYLMKRQHEQAIAEAERTIALDPNNANAYVQLGDLLVYVGRAQETIGLVEKAMRLNPHYPANYANALGLGYWATGRYEEAIAPLKEAIRRMPNFGPAHWNLTVVYSELGREAEARAEAAEILRISPNFSVEVLRQMAPLKDPAVLERYLDGLRKAGLK